MKMVLVLPVTAATMITIRAATPPVQKATDNGTQAKSSFTMREESPGTALLTMLFTFHGEEL